MTSRLPIPMVNSQSYLTYPQPIAFEIDVNFLPYEILSTFGLWNTIVDLDLILSLTPSLPLNLYLLPWGSPMTHGGSSSEYSQLPNLYIPSISLP